jgi:ABC-type antimicrobial peptide transport system permease subunit
MSWVIPFTFFFISPKLVHKRYKKERKETLNSISRYLVADAWFSKKPFVDQILAMVMHHKPAA